MKQYSQHFKRKKRVNGLMFSCLADDAPPELQELIHNIHFSHNFEGCLPNDWIYETIDFALDALEDNGNQIDDVTIEADVYTDRLKKWFMEPYAEAWIEEGDQDLGRSNRNIESLISNGQWLAIDSIYRQVHEFLAAQNGDTE